MRTLCEIPDCFITAPHPHLLHRPDAGAGGAREQLRTKALAGPSTDSVPGVSAPRLWLTTPWTSSSFGKPGPGPILLRDESPSLGPVMSSTWGALKTRHLGPTQTSRHPGLEWDFAESSQAAVM